MRVCRNLVPLSHTPEQESKPAGESSCGYDDDMYTVDDTDVVHLLPFYRLQQNAK